MKWVKVLIEVLLIALAIWAVIVFTGSLGIAEESYTKAWVICQPGDYVNARSRPSSRSESVGWFDGGEEILLDGQEKNGFLHCVGRFETCGAWIYGGYVVYEQPTRVYARASVVSKGKLQARKCVDGKRRCWLKTGDTVKVHWWTEEWCVTNKGFVMTKYLEMEGL